MTKDRKDAIEVPDFLRDRQVSEAEFKADMAHCLDHGKCIYHVCNGSGWLPSVMSIDGRSEKGLMRCKCLQERRRHETYKRLQIAGQMELYRHMTFEVSEGKYKHQEDAIRLMKYGPDGFYIFGNIGVGKTQLLACNVNRELDAGRPAALITVPQLVQAAKDTNGRISDLERLACTIPYLGLDDIGKEKPTGFRVNDVKDMLFRILDARYLLFKNGRGFTSFSSQWPRDEVEGSLSLRDKLDPAIVSRIREMTILVYLKSHDLRQGRFI